MEQNTQYIGEHLGPGIFGHAMIILAFTSILFSVFCYHRHQKNNTTELKISWQSLGRTGFILHGLSVFGIIGCIFYMMINQMYEYAYVFDHVSEDLPMKYIFSAFWEGQEGSFLLWMFWHIILGFILIKTAGKWESPVIMFLGIIQVIITSMLLGIHIEIGEFAYKLGSNPMLLLRDVFDAPIFKSADYLTSIKGSGLNPLLQNYWMTIHPPTLFLGFASTSIPFCFAAAGFYSGQYKDWLTPALKWSLFSAGILGVGILMGGAWAYEALTFGGYWAWDPVENMSLVPWLIMVAGIHTNLIANHTGRAIKSTYIYYALSFILVLYSTYLTRSGILGETSVHAFTEMGLEIQLIFLVALFPIISAILYFKNSKKVSVIQGEESIYSREFWMFVGALILLFSGVIIASSTSLPVFNAIIASFDPEFSGNVIQDQIQHYNKFQIWIAVLLCLISGNGIFLRYKTESWSNKQKMQFAKRLIGFFVAAITVTFLTTLWIEFYHWKYYVLAICAFFIIISNGTYLVNRLRLNPKLAGSVLSHVGFGVMIIGVLASGLNERVITTNPFVMEGLIKDEDLANSIKLIKNEPFFVNDYWITYESDTIIDQSRFFKVKFVKEDSTGADIEEFYVYPNVLFSNDLSKVAATNPDAKHYLGKDIFTSIASLPKAQMDVKFAKEQEDTIKYVSYTLSVGDTIFTKSHFGILEYLTFDPSNKDYHEHSNDLGMGLGVRFQNLDRSYNKLIEPAMGLNENLLYQYAEKIDELGIKLRLNDKTFNNFFSEEEVLEYEIFDIKNGDAFNFEGQHFELIGFNKKVDHKNYTSKDGDIAVQAIIKKTTIGAADTLHPIFVIRNSQPLSIKDYDIIDGIHIRLSHIDPVNEVFTIQIAKDKRPTQDVILDIAENIPRSDIIVLEAKIFPGINLFWLGSCLMMLGFFIAFLNRQRTKHG